MSAAGGGGGTPLKILFQILGINEGKAAIVSLTPEIAKIGTEADAAGKKITAMVQPLDKAGAAGSKLSPIAQNLDKTKTSSEGAAAGVTKVASSLDKSRSSSEGASSSIQKYTSEGTKAKTTTDGLSGSLDKSSTSSGKSSQSHDALASATGKVSSESTKTSKSVDALGNSNQKLGSTVKGVSGGLNEETNVLQKVGSSHTQAATATDKNTASNTSLKSSFAATMGSAAALGGGITSLWQTYDSLSDAQLRVDKATNTLHTTQTKIQSLQIQLNKLTAEGQTGTDKYALVQDKLHIAQDKLVASQGTLQNSQEDLNIVQAQFYQRIIPETISVLGSLTAVMANGKDALKFMKDGMGNLSIEALKTSNVMKLISLSNPFFLALTIGAGIVTAFVTNLFGFRDAINGVGVAIGNALGPLKPFLTMIGSLGEGLVNALGMGSDATKAYAETTTDAMDQTTDAVGGTEKAFIHWGQQQNSILKNADGSIAGYTTDFGKNMNTIKSSSGIMSSGIGTASSDSIKSMNLVIEEAKKVAEQLATTFSGTANLQGLNIKGLPSQHEQPHKLGTGVEGNPAVPNPNDFKGLRGKFLADLGLDELNTGFGTTIVNINKLKAKLIELGVPAQQVKAVADQLTASLHLQGVEADFDASGHDLMIKTIEGYDPALALNTKNLEDNAASSDVAAGSTAAFNDATKKHISTSKDAAGATEEQTKGQKKLSDMFGSQRDDLDAYNEILGNQAMMAEVVTAGIMKQDIAMKQGEVEVVAATAASTRYSQQLNTMEGASLEVSRGLLKENDALNQAKASMYQNIGVLAVLSDTTKMADAQNVALIDGFLKQGIATKQAEIAISDTLGTISRLRVEYESGEGRILAYNQGVVDQAKQFELDKLAVDTMVGKVVMMRQEWASGQAYAVAFNTGLEKQRIAFEESKKATAEGMGALKAMEEEWRSGEASLQAFNQGALDQATAFEKSKTAYDSNMGTLKELRREFDENNAAAVAFLEGFSKQELAAEQNKVAMASLTGEIVSLTIAEYKGTAQVDAFSQGMLDANKSFLDSVTNINKLEGGIASLQAHLNSGEAQSIAFKTGLDEATKSLQEQETATANLLGQTVRFLSVMGDAATNVNSWNKGVAEGYSEITKWGMGIEEAKGKSAGMISALDEVGARLGVKLPEGFRGTTEEAKHFMEVMAGVPDVIDADVKALDDMANSLTSGIGDAIAKGGEGLDDEFDKLEEKTGLKLNKAMKNAIEAAKLQDLWVDQMKNSVAALREVKFDPASFDMVADQIMERMNDAVAKNPGLQGIATQIQNTIDQLRVNPGNAQMWDQLTQLMNHATGQIQGTGKAMENTNGTLQNQTQYLANTNKQFQAMIENYRQLAIAQARQIVGGKNGEGSVMEMDPAKLQQLSKTRDPSAGGGATAGIDQSLAKVNELKTALASLPAAAATAVQGMSQQFITLINALNPIFMGIVEQSRIAFLGIATNADIAFKGVPALAQANMVTGLKPMFVNIVKDSGITFMGIAQVADAAFKAVPNIANQAMVAGLKQSYVTVVKDAGTAFSGIIKVADVAFQSVPKVASQTMGNGLKPVFVGIVKDSGTAFSGIIRVADTSFNTVAKVAQSDGKIVGSAFQSAGTIVGNAMNSAASRAKSAMSSIQSSANSANSSVRSLASSINSLKSKTITITTIYRQVIQRVYAAKGFGPSVVNSATNFTAGESGPELVSVIPLSQAANSGASSITSPSITNTRITNSIQNAGVNNMMGGGGSGGAITNTSSLTQQSSVLNRFSDSVSKITNAFNRQESMMNSVTNNTMIQNASTVGGNTRNISTGGFGITNTVTNNNNGIPNISTIRGGGGSARGGGDLESLVGAIKDMVLAAFGQTTINLNNTTTIDTEKVYEAQKKQFGLRNGSMFK